VSTFQNSKSCTLIKSNTKCIPPATPSSETELKVSTNPGKIRYQESGGDILKIQDEEVVSVNDDISGNTLTAEVDNEPIDYDPNHHDAQPDGSLQRLAKNLPRETDESETTAIQESNRRSSG